MTTSSAQVHDALIHEQFTRQANPFADLAAHSPAEMMATCLSAMSLAPHHRVLDVACGPGLLVTRIAAAVQHVTGVDVVPAMLERAHVEVERAGLGNVRLQAADARHLPFPDETFDRSVTRFSFHHLLDPLRVLQEMARVTKQDGRVVVIDATPLPDHRQAFDHMETLRDPSHTSALPLAALVVLFTAAGLRIERHRAFALHMELEQQLAASFPHPGDGERVRALFRQDAQDGANRLGLGAHYRAGSIHFAYPCSVVVGHKAT